MKHEDIGDLSIQFQSEKEDNNFSSLDINTTNFEDELGGQGVGAQEKVDKGDTESDIVYLNRPLWRGRICDLLNDDLTFFRKAKIIVCLLDKPFDEENLEDTDVGILFLLDGDLQMTLFWWLLTQLRLEEGRLLSEIVTWCFEHAESSGEDSGLEGVQKIPYRHIKRWKLSPPVDSKLNWKLSDSDVHKVSSLRCCKYRF